MHPHLPCQSLPRLEALAAETSFCSSCYLPSSKLSVAHIPGFSTSPDLASIMRLECLTPQDRFSVHAPKNKQRLVVRNLHPSFMIRPPIFSLTGNSLRERGNQPQELLHQAMSIILFVSTLSGWNTSFAWVVQITNDQPINNSQSNPGRCLVLS